MTTSAIAANAYSVAAKLNTAVQSGKSGNKVAEAGNFEELVKSAVEGVVESGKVAESKSAALMTGKADVVDVVTAIAETEVALETMVSVRDRVISAYEEIMRMPI